MTAPGKLQIVEVLRRYKVRLHYKTRLYAVFGPDGQLTEPAAHRDACEQRELLTASDIAELFTGEAG